MSRLDELAALHVRYGAAGVDLAAAVAPDLPPGWLIVTRRWAFRCWDALIQPPDDGPIGWRLADPFATSKRKAVQRATAEIRVHLARDAEDRDRRQRGEFTELEELFITWRASNAALDELRRITREGA